MWTCPKCGELNRDPGRCVQCNTAQPGSMFASMDALDDGLARSREVTEEIESSLSDEDRKVWNETGTAKPSKARRLLREAGLAPRKGGYRENAPPDEEDEGDADDDEADVEGQDERSQGPSILQIALIAIAVVLLVMSTIGFGRWTGPVGASAVPGVDASALAAMDEPTAPVATVTPVVSAPRSPVSASSTVPPPRPLPSAVVTSKAKATPACDTGCAKVTLPDGTPTWVGGSGGAGLPCCGELAEKAKAPAKQKCDPTCMYNGRCQILSSGTSGSAQCCKPIKDEFGCTK